MDCKKEAFISFYSHGLKFISDNVYGFFIKKDYFLEMVIKLQNVFL